LIRVIFGGKGAGKTKRIIDMANEMVKESTGSMVFVDDDNRYMFDLKHEIRFVDASDYGIDSPKMFYGFVCGLGAQDYDLEAVFVDGFLKIVKHPLSELEGLFDDLETFSNKFNVRLTISVSGDQTPEFIKKYLV
jgi:hypothetical protein